MSPRSEHPPAGLSILLVDDDATFARRLSGHLSKEGHDVQHAASGEAALERIDEQTFDVVLLDLVLPGMGGIAALQEIRKRSTTMVVIVMTAHGSIRTAVEAIRDGASDYVTKPVDLEALETKLQQVRYVIGMHTKLAYLLRKENKEGHFDHFVGESPAMQRAFEKIRDVATTESTTVLVTGESGTGKELASRAVHSLSSRRSRPFVQIDCTSIPVTLLESELFGHERGAFTGADRMKKGLLEIADGGTLFLDEIGDMALELQGKFLRVLQERSFRRVGGTRDFGFDVRVIAATNQDLEGLVDAKKFRQDLLFRLKVFEIDLPPLRERGSDVLLLASRFIEVYAKAFRKPIAGLAPEAEAALARYEFPGNVRELRNVIEQAVILAKGDRITRDQLSIRTAAAPVSPGDRRPALSLDALGPQPLQTAERLLIKQALERCAGNKTQAAELLGITRFALQRKLDKVALEALEAD